MFVNKPGLFITFLVILLILVFIIAVGNGALHISPGEVLKIVGHSMGLSGEAGFTNQQEAVLIAIRLPRVLFGILIGATLAVCGSAMQGLFRNPLADAGLMGISSGASLAAITIIVFSLDFFETIQNFAGLFTLNLVTFIGAFVTTIIVYRIARQNGRVMVSVMLLSGIAISAIVSAVTGTIILYTNDIQLRSITFWTLGSLGGANWINLLVLLPFTLVCIIGLPMLAKQLNTFVLGENNATYLGLNVEKLKLTVIILIALGVGSSVAVAGIIGFAGLVVPHIVRLIIGPEQKKLMIASALLGAILLVVADLFCRTIIAPAEIPIGIATALIGGPFFLYILVKDKRKNNLL
jgi:iron complex transport system permease protein